MSEGPYYAEVPITLQVRIEGFDVDPSPNFKPGTVPPEAEMRLSSLTPSRQSFMSSRNGRMTRWERVTWVANYEFTVREPGIVQTPDFVVEQGSKKVSVRGRRIQTAAVPTSDRIAIELVLPERPLFPGQRVPIEIRMKLDATLQNAIKDYSIRSPLFELQGDFNFIDTEVPRGQQGLTVTIGGETVTLERTVERKTVGGRSQIWLIGRRTLVPLRPGTFEIGSSSLLLNEVTSWRSGFGGRVPRTTELIFAKDLPRRLVVKDLPFDGRPKSFAGAVGKGFRLSVEANRTVVRTGDPIELTFTLTGDGNLQSAGLPLLTDAGLPASSFGAQTRRAAGILDENEKVFRVSIRANDASAAEIPPIEYSWYDVEAEAYRTTQTDPIALSVKQGEVVGASSVIGVRPTSDDPEVGEIPPPTGGRPRFVLDGADLSVEKRPERLLVSERDRFGGSLARTVLYLLSGLLIIASIGSRLRDRVSPEVRERRAALAHSVREVDKAASGLAGGEISPDALRSVVGTLRAMARDVKQGGSGAGRTVDGLEEFLNECEDRIYAPNSEGAEPGKVADRAKQFARALEEAGR